MPLAMEVDLGAGNIVLDGDPAKRGAQPPPNFRPMSFVSKWLLSISVFIFSFFISLFLFGSVRQIKLAVC